MAKQTINIGASPNDGTGTPLRTAFDYTNQNFTELYTATGPSGNNIVVPGNATITGDLTVDTNVLKVDTTNNRVGILNASPTYTLDVTGTANDVAIGTRLAYGTLGEVYSAFRFNNTSFAGGNSEIRNIVNGSSTTGSSLAFFTTQQGGSTLTERYRVDTNGVATWSNVGGVAGTAMTLNANGLGIGVTPSAWGASLKAFELGAKGNALFTTASVLDGLFMVNNAYYDTSYKYASTGYASRYTHYQGAHQWFTAASGTANNPISFGDAKMTLDASGNLLVGQTAQSVSTAGASLNSNGAIVGCVNGAAILYVNRKVNDGTLVSFLQDNTEEGTISVSGNTVSYNNFAGSHASQLQDGSKIEILRGTVMESINELCVWPNEENERLPKAKISDTAGSKKVYGVFMAWDNEWTITNDFLVTAVGAFICRVNGSVTVQEGDLLESNGDGTARVQADDIIRSSTIGKVTSKVKTHQYDDGSYCVPTVLYCG